MASSTETAVKVNIGEAQSLYQRGVAAARSGQKRIAAGLLTRSLQLDPSCELAWLWLSGVLDDPHEQAFCLEAVLKLNPNNEYARRGLRLLRERRGYTGAARPAPGLAEAIAPSSAAANRRDVTDPAWWIAWRHSRRETRRARLLLWAFPIALLLVALALHQSLIMTMQRAWATSPVADEAVFSVALTTPVPATPTIAPILEAEPLAVVEGLTVSYLAAFESVRADLRAATAAYREATSRPGGASVGHVAATQRLRAAVETAMAAMGQLRPPGTLQQAHDDYRRGLELQLAGLDALLEFYSGYDVANANRAAQRFQEARAYIERAQATLAGQARQLAEMSQVSSQTAR
ncbi:MAG: hypothetical protein RMK84_04070 [Oscillochloridaceae bacterium]|nr:hypothetical protein [Chloroflexaceae bacterium]MDW8389281.1 hypothetical protein [Oscillochloridaceae bacterium]